MASKRLAEPHRRRPASLEVRSAKLEINADPGKGAAISTAAATQATSNQEAAAASNPAAIHKVLAAVHLTEAADPKATAVAASEVVSAANRSESQLWVSTRKQFERWNLEAKAFGHQVCAPGSDLHIAKPHPTQFSILKTDWCQWHNLYLSIALRHCSTMSIIAESDRLSISTM